ncbi:unnamed protein product [Rotaria socialis]|uniref:Phospholipid scramblase n=1 Tax=Rotaria socialis TaxID=392032 RepID=A0A820H1L5_9BILA|nr:unnamed protein product [Rotaria socialis]
MNSWEIISLILNNNNNNKGGWVNLLGDSSGLAYLRSFHSLLAKQIMLGFASQAKYGIFNDQGEQVYCAFEADSTNQEIIHVKRELKCCTGCCYSACRDRCSQEVAIESLPGTVIGFVKQECSAWRVSYVLKDATGNPILTIVGPRRICDGPYPE